MYSMKLGNNQSQECNWPGANTLKTFLVPICAYEAVPHCPFSTGGIWRVICTHCTCQGVSCCHMYVVWRAIPNFLSPSIIAQGRVQLSQWARSRGEHARVCYMWLPDSSIGVQKQQILDAMIFITKRTLSPTL